MHVEVKSSFSTVDYCVFAAMIVVSAAIGVFTSCKGNRSPEEFLMGNRSFGPISVAMSLLTSFVSSISLLGLSGEAYAYGCQMSTFVVGVAFGIIAAGYIILPVIYPLKLTSVNEYIDLRFKDHRLMSIISFLTCLQGLLLMGMSLYAPTVALVSLTDFNYLIYIFLLGTVCTFYSSFGGIRAVVWTDVFQLSVMFIGLITIIVVGSSGVGGLVKALYTAQQGGRLEFFDINPSPYIRHTLLNTTAFGFFTYSQLYGTNQINVQRMSSVRSISDSQKVLILNVFGIFLIYFLIFVGGIIAYATYATCDPLLQGVIEKKEEIMPYFVVDKLSFIPGLPGMFVATLIAGTLSHLSSIVNATVAMFWRDVCLKFTLFRNASSTFATFINKVLSLLTGCLLIGFALIASKAENIIEVIITIMGAIIGPIYGVFLIGFLFPKCNLKGVWTGFIVSSLFVSWISVGGIIYKESPKMLPLNVNSCSDVENLLNNNTKTRLRDKMNYSNGTISQHYVFTSMYDALETKNYTAGDTKDEGHKFSIVDLYKISYTLYCVIGPTLCIVLALIVSCLTGNANIEEISPKYVTPSIRRFYWSKEALQEFERKERKYDGLNISPCLLSESVRGHKPLSGVDSVDDNSVNNLCC